jgi:hypothetical protein
MKDNVKSLVEQGKKLNARICSDAWMLGWVLMKLFNLKAHSNEQADACGKASGRRIRGRWDVFTEREFGISGFHAKKLMLVSRSYTADQVTKWGWSKLSLIAAGRIRKTGSAEVSEKELRRLSTKNSRELVEEFRVVKFRAKIRGNRPYEKVLKLLPLCDSKEKVLIARACLDSESELLKVG